MLELKKGADILSEIGRISSLNEAEDVFEKFCDKDTISKLAKITNKDARLKIANAISMMTPDAVFLNTGSEADILKIREMSLEKGEEKALAMKDHTIHFDLPDEQARIVDRTFYIVNEDETISTLAKKVLRKDAMDHVKTYMTGLGKDKTLLIGFFSRGPVGAPAALPAIEITTSTYVMHSGNILYRNMYDKNR